LGTIEIGLSPLVSSDLIDLHPPFIPIIEEHSHAVRLTVANINSCMLYPFASDCAERRKIILSSYLWFLSECNEQYVAMENSIVRAIINTPHIDIESLIRITNTNSQEAHTAGLILLFIHELHQAFTNKIITEKPSLSKATFFASTCIKNEQKNNKRKKKLATSKDQLERYWYTYKSASHLWLAAWLLQEELRKVGDPRVNSNMPVFFLLSDPTSFRKFFKIAEYYRHFGETFTLDNTGPLFGPNEAWRPTPNLELDGVTLIHENKVYPGLQDLITYWRKRKKW